MAGAAPQPNTRQVSAVVRGNQSLRERLREAVGNKEKVSKKQVEQVHRSQGRWEGHRRRLNTQGRLPGIKTSASVAHASIKYTAVVAGVRAAGECSSRFTGSGQEPARLRTAAITKEMRRKVKCKQQNKAQVMKQANTPGQKYYTKQEQAIKVAPMLQRKTKG